MLDQLMNLIKENSQDIVVNNPEVPDEQKEDIMREAATSISGGLQDELSNGNFKNVLKTLGGQEDNIQPTAPGESSGNSIVDKIKNIFMNNIMKKFGLSGSVASGIASSLIPLVMSKLIHKTKNPNDSSFSLEGIFNSLTGGKTSGLDLGGILNKVKGSGGDVDLNDISGLFSHAAKGEQEGGGLTGAVKGLFGGK